VRACRSTPGPRTSRALPLRYGSGRNGRSIRPSAWKHRPKRTPR